jgi:hypothetical protein
MQGERQPMNVTPADQAAGFKEIRIAMLDGKFEVVRVSVEKPEKLAELFVQKPTPVKAFIGEAIGRDLNFVEQIHPQSFHEIFLTAFKLLGMENLVRQAMLNVSEQFRQKANEP